jgi:hypothetical protein
VALANTPPAPKTHRHPAGSTEQTTEPFPRAAPAETAAARDRRRGCTCDTPPRSSSGVTTSRLVRFDTIPDALEFADQTPCPNHHCAGVHVVVWREAGRYGCEIFDDHQRRRSLADDIRRCYPRSQPRPGEHAPPPEWWPAPRWLNEPLQPAH